MADLLGVLIYPSGLSQVTHHGARNLPMFREESASPYGAYKGVFLSKGPLKPDEKRMRIRPTGPNNSGPYFNARLSGRFGVTSAEQAVADWNSSQGPFINLCNYSGDKTLYASPHYGKQRFVDRLYCDGQTVCCYEIWANEPDAYYHTNLAHFCAWSVRRVSNSPGWTRRQLIDCYYYTSDDGKVNWYTIDQIKQRYDYYVWNVLSGAQSGYIDPTLSHKTVRPWYNGESVFSGKGVNKLSLTDADIVFEHDELNAFEWWSITGVLEGRYRALAGQAYYEAANALPKAACNTIANVLEGASTVRDLLHGDLAKLLPGNPKDAWLFYRYQYSTTKLDIAEYKNLTERLVALAALPVIRSDGVAHNNGITAHCEIEVDPTYLIPQDTKHWLETYGFKLSWYNVWDMIPYSFVVDWFFHIGTFLEIMETENWMYSIPVIDSWTSFSTVGPGGQTTYFRVPGTYRAACPFLDYQQRSASGKTIGKRILDSIALFL